MPVNFHIFFAKVALFSREKTGYGFTILPALITFLFQQKFRKKGSFSRQLLSVTK